MRVVPFLQHFLKETSSLRLGKHCRDMQVSVLPHRLSPDENGDLGERISTIMLWGGPGRMILKVHFDLSTAVAWAARGLGQHQDDVDDSIAIDFMREYSNLHAGSLRGMFEAKGVLFGISLPFIMAGDSEKILAELRGPGIVQDSWILSDGENQVICTSEIELTDFARMEAIESGLSTALADETAKSSAGDSDGEVEFFL